MAVGTTQTRAVRRWHAGPGPWHRCSSVLRRSCLFPFHLLSYGSVTCGCGGNPRTGWKLPAQGAGLTQLHSQQKCPWSPMSYFTVSQKVCLFLMCSEQDERATEMSQDLSHQISPSRASVPSHVQMGNSIWGGCDSPPGFGTASVRSRGQGCSRVAGPAEPAHLHGPLLPPPGPGVGSGHSKACTSWPAREAGIRPHGTFPTAPSTCATTPSRSGSGTTRGAARCCLATTCGPAPGSRSTCRSGAVGPCGAASSTHP